VIHDTERVKAIRNRAASQMQIVSDFEVAVHDPGMTERLEFIRHFLEDIESFFLGSLAREQRTPEGEAYVLQNAEMVLERLIAPQVKQVQEIVAKFGPNVQSVG